MKKTIKILTSVLLTFVVLSSFIACEKDDFPNDVETPSKVQIGFSTSLSLQSKLNASKSIVHNYVKDGYTVVISDHISSDIIFENVDLNEILDVEITGDVYVSIYHPSFENNALDTVAYFGVDEFYIQIDNGSVNYVDLELVQGFILVSVENNKNKRVKSISISWQEAALDVVYYTGSSFFIVEVQTKRDGTYRGFSRNTIGQGFHYIIPTSNTAKELVVNKLKS